MAGRYEDNEQYEIQFTTRQLALVFGGLVLIVAGVFVGGILIGRGLAPGEAEALLAHRGPAPSESAPASRETTEPPSAVVAENAPGGDALRLPIRPGNEPSGAPVSSSPDQLAARTLAARSDAAPASRAPNPRAASARAPSASTAPSAAGPAPSPAPAVPAPRPTNSGGSPAGQFTIQLAAFRDRNAAEGMLARLAQKGLAGGYLEATPAGIFRVRLGSFESRDAAREVASRLRQEQFQTLVTRR